mgnify:FL=1
MRNARGVTWFYSGAEFVSKVRSDPSRILAALRKRLTTDGGAKLPDETRRRLEHLLEVSLPGMLDQSLVEMTRGLGRSVIDASNNDATIGAFRCEMIECVEAVAR